MRKKRTKITIRPDDAISERVRVRMDEFELGQKGLAELLEISEGYLSRILSGHRPWTIELLLKCASALSVPVEELDPGCVPNLKDALLNMELRGDIPQLNVMYLMLTELPRITDEEDLEALAQVIRAFAGKEARST